MRIVDLFEPGRPAISFEFFPPKTDAGFRSLFRTIEDLKRLLNSEIGEAFTLLGFHPDASAAAAAAQAVLAGERHLHQF